MNCTNCGEILSPGVNACPKCGTPVAVPQGVVQQPVVAPVASVPTPAPAAPVAPVTSAPVVEQPVQPVPTPVVEQPMQPTETFSQPAPTAVAPTMPAGMPQPSPIPVQQQPAPQPAPGVVPGIVPAQPANNGGSKKGLIIGIIVILLLAVLGLGGYFIYDKVQENKLKEEIKEDLEKYEDDKEEKEKIKEEIKNNVVVKDTKKLPNGSLLLTVKNGTKYTVGGEITLEFYGVNNVTLGSTNEFAYLGPNSECYVYVSQHAIKGTYETLKTNIDAEDYSKILEVKTIKETDLVKNETEDEIILQYNNTSKYPMTVSAFALFYSNNEIVAVLEDTDYDVTAGNNANLELFLFDIENVTYDRYEIVAYAEYDTYDD